ncbi:MULTISPECIES: MarR family transcriptional regulator [unclassified Rhizobium]|jgi:DNA-binding MarR family transcriptional regulator|uniref:MarR family winged helix-turn-helix transcriptional regulator n=1 Tax=unclassified Rhizobium TaxID=2613769 RepID=UPI000DD89223|nr:MarR family transcriptional regulator [Rhizobium sp. BG4]QRM44740.1 MarR family transcriptional regulator [Rhizobium sp. BG4]
MSDDLKLENFICFAMYTANHAMNRVYKPLLDELGLTYPQYLVMVALWEEDGQTVGGIGDKLFLESSTLTPLLKRLEAAGLIRRERSKEDERVVVIRLSDEGKALKTKAATVPNCIVDATGSEFDQLKRLRAEIIALRDALNKSAA